MRRAAIVEAAAETLRTQGVEGCTARAIAARAGLAKSAIHYYFEEIDQLVDLAWEQLMGRFVDRLEAAAEAQDDPHRALWSTAELYLRVGTERSTRIPMMTFDFLVSSVRKADTAAVSTTMGRITDLFAKLVAATGTDDAAAKAEVLMFTLVGTLVRLETHPRPLGETIDGASRVLGLPLASPTG